MALKPKELFGDATTQTPNLRAFPYEGGIKPGEIAALLGAPILPHLTPMTFDPGGDVWVPWGAATDSEEFTITAAATSATDGTFTLTVLGETTTALAHDAANTDIDAALEALSTVPTGGVTCAATTGTDLGDNDAVVTIVFSGALADTAIDVTADFSGLVGDTHVLANTVDGGGTGTDEVEGFLWIPEPTGVQTDALDSVLGQILRRGQVHYDDIPLPTTASQTQSGLLAAVVEPEVRKRGLDIVGVAGVH